MGKFDQRDGPSIIGVIFYALLVACIGALCGFSLLVSISPEPKSSIIEYENTLEAETVSRMLQPPYYLEGSKSAIGDWEIKREFLLTANKTSLEIKDSEANAWLAEKFSDLQPRFLIEGKIDAEIEVGAPNIFIDSAEGIHFSIPLNISITDKQADCVLVGQGTFSNGSPTEFNVNKLSLNQAVVPLPGKTSSRFLSYLLKPLYEDDEFIRLKEAWGKVGSLALIENRVQIELN